MVIVECECIGANIATEENRREIVASVTTAQELPKKQRKVDEDGHAVSTAVIGVTTLFCRNIDELLYRDFAAGDA